MSVLLVSATITLASCAGTAIKAVPHPTSTVAASADAALPAALAKVVPAGYLADHLWRKPLTGGPVPEAIVASSGPVKPLKDNPQWSYFTSADLQVLTWDAIASRWTAVFDGQKLGGASTDNGSQGANSYGPGWDTTDSGYPRVMLDKNADVQIGKVRFAKLLKGKGEQLIFGESTNYGGSGAPGMLVAVDFTRGFGAIDYQWNGDRFDPNAWSIHGTTIEASAQYWTPADAHCCASVKYHWGIRLTPDGYTLVSDSRPWLGVTVRSTADLYPDASLRVLDVFKETPAYGRLRKGDVITEVVGAPLPPHYADGLLDSKLYPQIARMHPGDVARLRVKRGNATLIVPVTLGSLADSSADYLDSVTNNPDGKSTFKYDL